MSTNANLLLVALLHPIIRHQIWGRMAAKPHDTNPISRYHKTAPPNSETADTRRVRPSRSTGHTRPRLTPAITDIRIARIEMVTMTATEYDNAVEALAVLIAHWWQQHPDQAA
jgi:hypothetical protein